MKAHLTGAQIGGHFYKISETVGARIDPVDSLFLTYRTKSGEVIRVYAEEIDTSSIR